MQMLYKLSGFIDIDKINPDAWPAIIADLSTGEQGIAALAFGMRRFYIYICLLAQSLPHV